MAHAAASSSIEVAAESPISEYQLRRRRRRRSIRVASASRKERDGALLRALDLEEQVPRPRSRSECAQGPRPCPFVSCRHHLYLEVSPDTGTIKLNFPELEVWELSETCSLDVAATGDHELAFTGRLLNLTRERIRQIEVVALSKLAREPRTSELDYPISPRA